jgi:hypothetical protein
MKLSDKILTRTGVLALALIEARIEKGIDVDGKPYHYSTKPFYMPYNKGVVGKLGGKTGAGNLYQIVNGKKSGKLGMIILGGYKSFKENVHPDVVNNFLTVRGTMLRNMKNIGYLLSRDGIILGWSDPVQAQKAFWLNVSGAGRGRKLWKFFGLSEEDRRTLSAQLEPYVTKEISEQLIQQVARNFPSVTKQ